MPPPRRIGRPRQTDLREIVNAVLYMASTGCQWRMLPKDFPPVSTVQRYFYQWRDSRLWQTIRFHLAMQTREREGREAQPTAGVIDSQTVKTTEAGGVRGYDAGKKINGRKRHTVVDTTGMLFGLVVHAADVQDRDGAPGSAEIDTPHMPLAASPVCRRRIRRTETARRPGQDRQVDARDRQALRHRQGLRSPAPTMGRRTHLCMARAMSAAGKRLGEIHRLQRGMDQHRPYPTHNAAARKVLPALNEFRVRR